MENIEKKNYCLFKSSICFYKTKCKKGEECKFAHNNSELEPIKCWFNYQGYCEKEDCQYWHKNNENKEQFYIRTNKIEETNKFFNIKTKNKKLYSLTEVENNEVNKKSIINKIVNENNKQNKEIENINFKKWEENKDFSDIIYYTDNDNEEVKEDINKNMTNIVEEQKYIYYTIIKNLNKDDFIKYYKSIKEEIIFIEKNNTEYKIVIRTTLNEVDKLLKNEIDDYNNLPF
jgi:hypothetical protein